MDTLTNTVGLCAAVLTTSCFIPQLIKIIKTKQTNDLSLGMYIMFFIGVTCWEIYGIMLKALPVIIANLIGMGMNVTIIYYKLKYK